MEELLVCGKRCIIEETGTAKNVFLWAYHDFSGDGFEHLISKLREAPSVRDCIIAAFTIEDWDAELSPWKAPQAFGSIPFSGKGPETLEWLTWKYIPFLKERFPEAESFYTVGYSLAGLFSLWALYETDLLSGCVCCSGSLWLDHWDTYAASHWLGNRSEVYLSLGGKEEKTKNLMMMKVGDRTREQAKLLLSDPNIKGCILEWNRGGHFADAEERIAKGIRYIAVKNPGRE